MPSNAHVPKRPYAGSHFQSQQQITSFFNTAAPCSATNHSNRSSQPLPTFSSAAHPQIQADLLSVGMRVRKSVPEGCKTGSQYSAFSLFSDASAPELQGPPLQVIHGNGIGRELQPWCGLHRTGGLSPAESIEEGDVPFLGSQSSTISDASSFEYNPRKRRISEEGDEDVDDTAVPEMEYWLDDAISPKSQGTPNLGWESRPFAKPKTRRRPGSLDKVAANVHVVGEGTLALDGDFGEASFLSPSWS
jgi:hypothetical protein